MFQSTRPHGARRNAQAEAQHCERVSIHAPARGATCESVAFWLIGSFQSTRPHGARPHSVDLPDLIWGFQSTRPHGARHFVYCGGSGSSIVSIHAPARGATFSPGVRATTPRCFNPRARTGRDVTSPTGKSKTYKFQSTRPHGARLQRAGHAHGAFAVSIHAPARGATQRQLAHRACRLRFNPRARTGRDETCRNDLRPARGFNPRARTGRDDHERAWCLQPKGFNPRARTGRDLMRKNSGWNSMFQSTRPHGARQHQRVPVGRTGEVSIHAPARGATLRCHRLRQIHQFQSTRPHGARPVLGAGHIQLPMFQSTRPHGARRDGFA